MTVEQVAAALEDIEGCAALAELLSGARANGPIRPLRGADYPIRIVWALHDRTLPFMRYGAPMLQSVPGAEFAFMADVGHVPMIDDPAAVAESILAFAAAQESSQ
jgi:pimeloyl-ACP methyl ester carboxylesterase